MATSKLQLPGGLRVVNGVPDIAKYWNNNDTPYTSTAQVLSEIPIGIRHTGLKVQVLTDEYWWPTDGGVTDGELVLYSSGAGGGFYQTIAQNGTPLIQRATLNVSNGITAADDGTDTTLKLGGALTGNTLIDVANGVLPNYDYGFRSSYNGFGVFSQSSVLTLKGGEFTGLTFGNYQTRFVGGDGQTSGGPTPTEFSIASHSLTLQIADGDEVGEGLLFTYNTTDTPSDVGLQYSPYKGLFTISLNPSEIGNIGATYFGYDDDYYGAFGTEPRWIPDIGAVLQTIDVTLSNNNYFWRVDGGGTLTNNNTILGSGYDFLFSGDTGSSDVRFGTVSDITTQIAAFEISAISVNITSNFLTLTPNTFLVTAGSGGFSVNSSTDIELSATTDVLLASIGSFIVNTNSSVRLTIESDGSWNIGGSNGTSGQVLTSNGAGSPPTWQNGGGGGGTVTSVSGTTNRITSTGGTTPVIDISATFEALLSKVAQRIDQNNAATTSSQLASVISDETGTGSLVFSNSPTFVTPVLGTVASGSILTNATGLPISTGVSGLGTGVSTFLGVPSWTNFNSMITGTSPFWSLSSGGTLTGVNTITSNAANQLIYTGTWTATANNDFAISFGGTFTARNTASDNLIALRGNNTLIASAASQTLIARSYSPTYNVNSQSSINAVGEDYNPTITGTLSTHVAKKIRSGVVLIGTATLQGSSTGLQINGTGTTSGVPLAVYNTTPSLRFFVQDNGISAHTTTFTTTANGQSGFGINGTITGRAANADTFYAHLINTNLVFGANSQKAVVFGYNGSLNDPSFTSTTVSFLDYDPAITNAPDIHYGIRIVPSDALNAFGQASATALVDIAASTTTRSSLRIRSGTAPTSPNDGDIWFTGSDLMIRIGGTSRTIQVI